MKDTMNELVNFSPFGGKLLLEEVKGTTSGQINPENNVDVIAGMDRDMYVYIPKSGCPHAKQTQVLMVLRNENTDESAEKLMKRLQLDRLAEERHFILVFPNPVNNWHYHEGYECDEDRAFLVRCFAALPKSKGKVAGFNGMIFYLATTPESSALVCSLAIKSPLDAAAIMIGRTPDDYEIPEAHAKQVAWIYEDNNKAIEWLKNVNTPLDYKNGIYFNQENKNVMFVLSKDGLNAETVHKAWETVFSETRRWRNDITGTYQKRINFSEKGYVAHVKDDSLGDNNSFKHTWYEYVPEALRGTEDKVPLVIYLHGINCVALYGAEQSGWSDIADREGFIVIYPNPSIEERWNVWDDPRIPRDSEFIMALIDHMKQVHPIDEKRIYLSGFSMGSMFSNAMASLYPETFAGVVALNGPHQGYLKTLEESIEGIRVFRKNTILNSLEHFEETESPLHKVADQKKNFVDYRMPVVQFAGLQDGVGFNPGKSFPVTSDDDGMWSGTIKYWNRYNHTSGETLEYTPDTNSGFVSDRIKEFDRYVDQSWIDDENRDLYHFVTVKRMPHAVDLTAIEYGWDLIKKYYRNNDGTLGER